MMMVREKGKGPVEPAKHQQQMGRKKKIGVWQVVSEFKTQLEFGEVKRMTFPYS